MLGLPRNVLVWDGEQLGTWLDALGLGQVVPAFLDHNIPLTLNPNPDPDPDQVAMLLPGPLLEMVGLVAPPEPPPPPPPARGLSRYWK